MNDFFSSFVATARAKALDRGLSWEPAFAADGKICKAERWNLTELAGTVPPPTVWLSSFGHTATEVEAINAVRKRRDATPVAGGVMPRQWRELYKGTVLNEILVKQTKPPHALGAMARAVRLLALAAGDSVPWKLNGEQVELAYNAALRIGGSGKLAANLEMAVRVLLDQYHLTDSGPLARFCSPYANDTAVARHRQVEKLRHYTNTYASAERVRSELQQRKNAGALPEHRAFWELVRIVFTETPTTFSDAIRFAQIKIAIVTGFRVGENATIPADWERWRDYVDANNRPAGTRGGISRSLMIRYFAEKQSEDHSAAGVVLYENAQHVPEMYRDLVLETMHDVARLTRPMRERLRQQTETGRLLPEYQPNDVVSAVELYPRLAGGAQVAASAPPGDLLARYRASYDPADLELVHAHQMAQLGVGPAFDSIRKFWSTHILKDRITRRDAAGCALSREARVPIDQVYFRVAEVESFIRQHLPTKLPDVVPFRLPGGQELYPYEFMFLMPIRALIENRNDGLLDANRYFAWGRVSPADMGLHLGRQEDNLFARYGETSEDRQHKLETHSLRHLQNAELFRLGVADTIITQRFRKSVSQSHVYDHRSLAEELDDVALPPVAEATLGPRAQEALALISAGKVKGPIVDEFLRVQRELGDDAAFAYLEAEADGLHVTPYGFCLNSFTVDPCPKHLECFNGCRHLARSTVPEEQRHLERLRDRIVRIVAKLEKSPAGTPGWRNQMEHAKRRLKNIEHALATAPGQAPFPDGPDLYRPLPEKRGSTVMDMRPRVPGVED